VGILGSEILRFAQNDAVKEGSSFRPERGILLWGFSVRRFFALLRMTR
jgi:hypothetical protein